MPIATRPPTSELGQTAQASVLPWAAFTDDQEHVPELQWPVSVTTYSRMRNDAQIEGLLAGATMPIRRYRWMIDPNNARPEVVDQVAHDLNLPVQGDTDRPAGRRKRRFSHDRHLFHALLALTYGHSFMEQVGEIDDNLWHLRKLAPRLPHTLSEIRTARDGGLEGITQHSTIGQMGLAPQIPVNRLVAYVWQQEAGNWVGRSMLRACYRNWLIKDRQIRIDPMLHERAGGIPYIEAPPGASADQIAALSQMAQQLKMGEHAGGAVPNGAKVNIAGTRSPDVVSSMRFHNEEMARAFLMMFMQLGQTETGSRALGSEFIDWFSLAQQTIAGWYADTTNEHVIEDWVDWNYGDDEQAPLLTYETDSDPDLAVSDLAAMVEKGMIIIDRELEEWIRGRYRLPVKAPEAPDAPSAEPPAQTVPVAASMTSEVALMLPSRPLRRHPYEHEVQAAVDFAAIEATLLSERDLLFNEVRQIQRRQIDALHDQIVEANGDLRKLASVAAQPAATDTITTRLIASAERGALQVEGEASRQGTRITKPNLNAANTALARRAQGVDALLTAELSAAAGRKALALTGGTLSPAEVAGEVKGHLNELTGSRVADQLGGALWQGTNTGRRAAIAQGDPERIYSSELLDTNTCSACVERDGTEYVDLSAAEGDYPTGGFKGCDGGDRCRGTLIAQFAESEAAE